MSTIDIAGQRFGRLVALSVVSSSRSGAMWLCHCDCGAEPTVRGSKLRSGRTASCGCGVRAAALKHGMHKTRTYKSWQSMRNRCLDKGHKSFARYGGRGIAICERWGSFENFLADMGERPDGKTLDRYPDRNGNYEPGNCRWATVKEQNRNRNSSVLSIEDEKAVIALRDSGASNADIALRFGVSRGVVAQTIYQWRRSHGA